MRTRLYRLATLTHPRPAPPGRLRVAGPAERELLVSWYEAFAREAWTAGGAAGALVDDRLAYGGLGLWDGEDGCPVAMVGATRQVAGMVRVAPVYTPAQHRRRGYAGAVTAAISERALAAGASEVLIFADLDNPTTPGLYERLGYRPVEDRVILAFHS